MVVVFQETSIGLALFAWNAARYEAVDFTWPVTFITVQVFAGRGSPEVDPWGFVLPLGPWVWMTLLSSLLLISIAYILIAKLLQAYAALQGCSAGNLYIVNIMLHQCKYLTLINININKYFILKRIICLRYATSLGGLAARALLRMQS